MMNNRSRAYNKPCWSKSRANNKILCSACYSYRSSQLFATNYCSSSTSKHSIRQICDTCVHQYIVSQLDSCITSSISCPELDCCARFSQSTVRHILLKHESNELLNDYLREQQWEGKSEEWIIRFTLRCPGCNIPIEKDGGCNQMICSRCQLHFYWSRANRYGGNDRITARKSCMTDASGVWIFFGIIIILFIFAIFV